MKRLFLIPLAALLFPVPTFGEEEPVLKVAPTGRVLVDGALYASPQKEMFPDGMAISEARIGAKMSYGKWSALMDVAYSYSKIGLRNMWIEYNFNPRHRIRVGNYIQPFGLESTYSKSLKCTFEQPLAADIFTPGIQLGMMYGYTAPSVWVGAGFHVESSALTNAMNAPLFNQQGYGILGRGVWRKATGNAPILQFGVSAEFATPQRRLEGNEDVHDGFTMSANYPTKVVQESAVGTTVANSKNMFKFSPEFLIAKGKLAAEGQYFFQSISRRKDLHSYTSQSGYVSLRGLITGGDYAYASGIADLDRPRSGALECVLNYNYVTLSDSKADIYGGRANNFNLTLNYYINPYITARLNYTYTHTWDRAGHAPVTMNGFQARIMVLF